MEFSISIRVNRWQLLRARGDGQTAATCNQLSSFINQVTAFRNNGSLTASQGQGLIDDANAIGISLGC